jgi:transcriptional regulator with XRE-family HTH domain
MARAALEWGMRDLAKAADIAPNTVMRFETGRNAPNPVTLKAMRQAFEAAGIRFEGGGVFPPEEASK